MPRCLSSFTGKQAYRNKEYKHSPQEQQELSGAGVGRQRVDEPLFGGEPMPSIPRSDMGLTPRVSTYGQVQTTPVAMESKQPQKGSGQAEKLPGDALKLKLIRKLVCAGKKEKKKKSLDVAQTKQFKKTDAKINTIAADKLFPLLFKKIDPSGSRILEDPKKKHKALGSLKALLKAKVKNPKSDAETAEKIAMVFADVFGKIGHSVPDNAASVLKNEILSALFKIETGTFSGSGKKSKAFWRDFGSSFKKTLKVGLPIAALIAPELAPVALAAELLL